MIGMFKHGRGNPSLFFYLDKNRKRWYYNNTKLMKGEDLMVKVREDMTGWKMWEHGVPDSRLTVIKQVEDYVDKNGIHHSRWLCECNCEAKNKIIVSGSNLKNKSKNGVRSCGCLRKEFAQDNLKKYNNVKLNLKDKYGVYGIGFCSNTGSKFYFDMDDYDKIKDYTWNEHVLSSGYHALEAWDSVAKKVIRMHYLLIDKGCDHADRNPLNNRRYNLRKATLIENAQNHTKQKTNTSGVVGVEWRKDSQKWCASITVNKNRIWLGYFINKNEAITTRLKAEAEYFGEFAPQRHLFEQYKINEKKEACS